METCVYCGKPAPRKFWEVSGWVSVVRDELGHWHDAMFVPSQEEPSPAHETCYDKDVEHSNAVC